MEVKSSENVSCSVMSDSLQPQARILEWVAIPFSSGSSQSRVKPGSPSLQADFSLSELGGLQSTGSQRYGHQE